MTGLCNIYLLLLFVMSFFATFGVNMFSGYSYRACRSTEELIYGDDDIPYWPKAEVDRLCNSDEMCQVMQSGTFCGSLWETYDLNPRKYDQVFDNELIFYGIPGFDNFLQAFVTVFQICTLEGWSYLMYNYLDSSDYPIVVYIFFPLCIITGSFFVLNLILA